MDIFTIIFWIITLLLTLVSFWRNKEGTLVAMKKSKGMMGSMLGQIVGIIFIIGLILTFIPPDSIRSVLGSSNTFISTIIAALAGAITLIPAFVAFPWWVPW